MSGMGCTRVPSPAYGLSVAMAPTPKLQRGGGPSSGGESSVGGVVCAIALVDEPASRANNRSFFMTTKPHSEGDGVRMKWGCRRNVARAFIPTRLSRRVGLEQQARTHVEPRSCAA